MSSPTVSIIVPVYNVKEYVPRCLDSLISQTLQDIEIITIDDGSTDGSSSILDSYSQKDDRVKVIHVENGGVSKARNIGLDKANGEFIGFVDSDDFVDSTMFDRLVSRARESAADCVQCSIDVVEEGSGKETEGRTSGETTVLGDCNEIMNRFFDGKIDNSVCDKIFRKSIIGNIRFPLGWSFAEDFYFNAIFLLGCRIMVLVDDVLYHYFMRNLSSSHEMISDRHLKGFHVYDIIKKHIKEEGVLQIVSEKEVSESLRFLDSSIGHDEVSKSCINGLIERIRTGRRWIKRNRYMSAVQRSRARFICIAPHGYVSAVKMYKKLRRK